MYFAMTGVYILPYVKNGIQVKSLFINYDVCLTDTPMQINDQSKCDLFTAGIGTQVSMMTGYAFSWIALLHGIIILMGFGEWKKWHKLCWILTFISAMCYAISVVIWQLFGHIDILSHKKIHSESHSGMKFDVKHG